MHTPRPRLMKPTLGEIVSRWGDAHQHPQYQGCVGHWAMVEGGGTALYDLSGYGNVGTLTSATLATAWTTGRYGPSLTLDGTDDFINVGADFPLALKTTPFSIIANITPSAIGAEVILVARWDVVIAPGWQLYLEPTGIVSFIMTDSGGANFLKGAGSTVLSAGSPYVAGLSYDGSASPNGVSLYVDGLAQAMTPSTLGTGDPGTLGASALMIGKRNYGPAPACFPGTFHTVRMFNRSLTPGEQHSIATDPWAPWQARRRTGVVSEEVAAGNPWYHHAQQ